MNAEQQRAKELALQREAEQVILRRAAQPEPTIALAGLRFDIRRRVLPELADIICAHETITSLNIAANNVGRLNADAMMSIGRCIKGNRRLTQLYLHSNYLGQLHQEDMAPLAASLQEAPRLTKLFLGNNGLGLLPVPSMSLLCSALKSSTTVSTLVLMRNDFGRMSAGGVIGADCDCVDSARAPCGTEICGRKV